MLLAALLLIVPVGCGGSSSAEPVILASTTSTQDSGLFAALIPAFEKAYPQYDIQVVAVGTGEALALGARRDADVLLVHAPAAESAYVAAGHAVERRPVMTNRFIIVGPQADPAGVRGMSDAAAALRRIAERHATFVSRGDDSGTHKREKRLWAKLGLDPHASPGDWYLEAGQGMGDVLLMSGEKGAYTLSDISTYRFMQDKLALVILVDGDPALLNPYHVITVKGAKNPAGGKAFLDWITGPEGQAIIRDYGSERFGSPLFHANP